MSKIWLRRGSSLLVLSAVALLGAPVMASAQQAGDAPMAQKVGPSAPRPGQTPDSAVQSLSPAAPHAADSSNAPSNQPGGGSGATVGEVVVTGTSIRGVAPVGSNLIAVGPSDIKATGAVNLEQALANVPALTGMGSVGQGQTNNSYYQPTIHSLGASASNSTLILIDGHRLPTGGTNHSTADPNILPLNMVQRVEVLPEGASSVYGSDAVAGVVNFITRKKYDGVQLTAQGVFENGASGYSAGALAGRSWDQGSAIMAYTHLDLGELDQSQRAFTNWNHTSQGGTNFNNFSCGVATIQPGGAGPIYLSPTSGVAVTNTAANAPCSQWAYTSLVQKEVRNNAMIKVSEDLSDRFSIGGELLAASRRDQGITPAGTVQATVFGTGAQANPFYVRPAGYTGAATSETIRWDADGLVGPARAYNGSDNVYGDFTAEYKIGDNFVVDFLALVGRDDSFSRTEGTINSSVANLELNGTTNGGGSLTAPSIPGTSTIVTQLPLTTANALDVWGGPGANRTSAAALAMLTDNANLIRLVSTIQQYRLSTNGKLFSLPGGDVRIAIGGELLQTGLNEYVAHGNNAGPASTGSDYLNYNFTRHVVSAFGEVDIPIIGRDMNIPLVQSFVLNASGRYDHYSDFGTTVNPKVAFDWKIFDDLKIRGNWSTSFVAPPLDILGTQYGAFATSSFGAVSNSLAVPVATYPAITQLGIPGCTAASVTCNISSLQGVQITSGNHNAKAQTGSGWSVGFDYLPSFVHGLHVQATLWNTSFTGGITGPNIATAINASGENYLLTFYPGCATPAQIAQYSTGIPQTSSLPACASYIYRSLNSNFLDLYIQGIDASVDYTYHTDNWGTFRAGGSLTQFLSFQQAYAGGPKFNILNTSGYNTSFPSVASQARVDFGWNYGGLAADVFVNYTGGYHNYAGTSATVITKDAHGNPSGGGDWVNANTTVDLHLAYDLSTGWFKGDQVSLTVRNLFDKTPPFFNSTMGFDSYVANPLGRVITLGVTASF